MVTQKIITLHWWIHEKKIQEFLMMQFKNFLKWGQDWVDLLVTLVTLLNKLRQSVGLSGRMGKGR